MYNLMQFKAKHWSWTVVYVTYQLLYLTKSTSTKYEGSVTCIGILALELTWFFECALIMMLMTFSVVVTRCIGCCRSVGWLSD